MGDPDYLLPFFTFFGGKWKSAPKYPRPAHSTIIEPFAGSAGYSLNHYRRDVILNEIDPNISSIWRFLINASPGDIYALPDLEQWQDPFSLDIDIGAANLMGFWCGRGRATPGRRLSGWGKEPRYSRYYWGREAKERIASQVNYIKHWTLLDKDCSHILHHLKDDPEVTWFIDPPYQKAGTAYMYGSKLINYSILGQYIQSLSGQVIVCEGSSCANWLPFRTLDYSLGNNGSISMEYIWTND